MRLIKLKIQVATSAPRAARRGSSATKMKTASAARTALNRT